MKRYLFIACLFLVSACSAQQGRTLPLPSSNTTDFLFQAMAAIQDGWQHMPLRGTTDYSLVPGDGGVVIRAEGRKSASGLIRRIEIDPRRCPTLEWRWRVDHLQQTADLDRKETEDVAASIFLLFGDPGFMFSPKAVPTLRYVWTNGRHSRNAVIDNPYLSGVVRSIVIRSGDRETWFTESRNLNEDYERAFGSAPQEPIRAIALFTDNDQTGEPVLAYYAWARVRCDQDAPS